MDRFAEVEENAVMMLRVVGWSFGCCVIKIFSGIGVEKEEVGVFPFRLTSQRKEQMIHFKKHQSHDALPSTSNSDKADQSCPILTFLEMVSSSRPLYLSEYLHHLINSISTLIRVYIMVWPVVNYQRNTIPHTRTQGSPLSV